MSKEALFPHAGETGVRPIEVLVLSADLLRGDLLEAGIRKSDRVANSTAGNIWSDDLPRAALDSSSSLVVVIDLDQPEVIDRGLELGDNLSRYGDGAAIVVLAGSPSILTGIRTRMVDVGPRWSFLTTDLIKGLDDLLRVIDSAASGMTIVDPGFFPGSDRASLVDSVLNRPLTARQVEVLELVSQGYNNDGVANRLKITPRTVEYHLNEAYMAIKHCHSPEHNPRVYAARIFKECFGQTELATPVELSIVA